MEMDGIQGLNGGVLTRVLVTGTSGFIGTSFCERNAGRYAITGVDCRDPTERFRGVEYENCDLRNRNHILRLVQEHEPEVILHLAAQARVDPSIADPVGTYRSNVDSTVNLLEAAMSLPRNLDRFVYVSSETVYGPSSSYPVDEETPLRPQSAYAASKAAAEFLVRNTHGLRFLVLRSGMGYGPRSNPRQQVVAKFISRALDGEPLFFPAGVPAISHPTRDVNYVDNFVDGVTQAIDDGAEGVFNLGSGRELSVLELAHEIVKIVGSGAISFDAGFRYRPGELGLRTWLDISRARDAFGYSPRVGLRDGLNRTVGWMRKHPSYWEGNGRASVHGRRTSIADETRRGDA